MPPVRLSRSARTRGTPTTTRTAIPVAPGDRVTARSPRTESHARGVAYQLLCGLFEDVFPAVDELEAVRREIRQCDYESLSVRQTHHGRGLSEAFCDLEAEAVAASKDPGRIWARVRELNLWIPARALNTFYTWTTLQPRDTGMRRSVDLTPWKGMRTVMLDRHTAEGRQRRSGYTILSGDYDTHRKIGRRVMWRAGTASGVSRTESSNRPSSSSTWGSSPD
jgi:hypothetical protein